MEQQEKSSKTVKRLIIIHFLLIFITIGIILTGAIAVFYSFETKDDISKIENKERFSLELQRQLTDQAFKTIISDLRFLSNQNELLQQLSSDKENVSEKIAQEYLQFGRERQIYDQIRFIDDKEKTLVMVRFEKGEPPIPSKEILQKEDNDRYFKESYSLDRGDVNVSNFTLGMKDGEVDKPLKPILRFGTPVFDAIGRKRGIIVLDYLGLNLISSIRETSDVSLGETLLLTPDGFWLCSPRQEDEWGFVIKERSDRKFSHSYPDAWDRIATRESDQFRNEDGLFTFTTVYPLFRGIDSVSGPGSDSRSDSGVKKTVDKSGGPRYLWKLVSHVPSGVLHSRSRELFADLFLLAVVLCLLSSIPSWFMAQVIVRRRSYQKALWETAVFDNLTGLPNRSLFQYRLEQTLLEANRYDRHFVILFLDLDGFKDVNDTLGHDAGDLLLQKTSKRLMGCLRKSDTIARIGGDEFTIILPEISKTDHIDVVAQKIITTLSSPFTLKGTQLTIGVSIGIAMYPKDGDDADTLLRNADIAMYQAKARGKNSHNFYNRE